jgi:hypothetical protein
MKTINLLVVEQEGIERFDYKAQLLRIARQPLQPQGGMDLDEMRNSIRIIEALEKTQDGVVQLEDADYAFLVRKLDAQRWGFAHQVILDFADSIKAAGNGR